MTSWVGCGHLKAKLTPINDLELNSKIIPLATNRIRLASSRLNLSIKGLQLAEKDGDKAINNFKIQTIEWQSAI